jgi:hypothetical protein
MIRSNLTIRISRRLSWKIPTGVAVGSHSILDRVLEVRDWLEIEQLMN